MPTPETVTEAVELLATEGYTDEFTLCERGLVRSGADEAHPLHTAVVDYTFRFEGPSDPADEAIVLGVRCPEWDRKGVVVSAFGPEADPKEAELLASLSGTGRFSS